MMNECAFCEPATYADRVISQNSLATAFLSSPRLTPGHSLVIPKRHIELPSELSSEETTKIFDLIHLLHAKLLGSIALGVDIWQKSRPYVSQDGHKMDHVHFHVLPSNPADEMYEQSLNWRRSQFSPLVTNERDQMIALLKED